MASLSQRSAELQPSKEGSGNFQPWLRVDIVKCISWLNNGSIFGGDDRGSLKEGPKSYLMALMPLLILPNNFFTTTVVFWFWRYEQQMLDLTLYLYYFWSIFFIIFLYIFYLYFSRLLPSNTFGYPRVQVEGAEHVLICQDRGVPWKPRRNVFMYFIYARFFSPLASLYISHSTRSPVSRLRNWSAVPPPSNNKLVVTSRSENYSRAGRNGPCHPACTNSFLLTTIYYYLYHRYFLLTFLKDFFIFCSCFHTTLGRI